MGIIEYIAYLLLLIPIPIALLYGMLFVIGVVGDAIESGDGEDIAGAIVMATLLPLFISGCLLAEINVYRWIHSPTQVEAESH